MRRPFSVVLRFAAVLGAAFAVSSASAVAGTPFDKGIWGPTGAESAPYIATATQLGAKRYLTTLRWADIAPTRPRDPADPADPAYVWPAGLTDTLRTLAAKHFKVTVDLTTAPAWANRSTLVSAPPVHAKDYATFAATASRKYPQITDWQIWSEPTKTDNWAGLIKPSSGTSVLTAAERRAPVRYAELLDAAYGAIKKVDRRDEVIGGNTWTVGTITPLQWIRAMHLPNRKAPRMDVFGHNPFSARAPDAKQTAIVPGDADINDLDDVERWLDRWQRRPGRRPLPIYLTEFAIPSAGASADFNFYVSDDIQGKWTAGALALARADKRVRGLAWIGLFDSQPGERAATMGLVRADGSHKPAFAAFAAG